MLNSFGNELNSTANNNNNNNNSVSTAVLTDRYRQHYRIADGKMTSLPVDERPTEITGRPVRKLVLGGGKIGVLSASCRNAELTLSDGAWLRCTEDKLSDDEIPPKSRDVNSTSGRKIPTGPSAYRMLPRDVLVSLLRHSVCRQPGCTGRPHFRPSTVTSSGSDVSGSDRAGAREATGKELDGGEAPLSDESSWKVLPPPPPLIMKPAVPVVPALEIIPPVVTSDQYTADTVYRNLKDGLKLKEPPVLEITDSAGTTVKVVGGEQENMKADVTRESTESNESEHNLELAETDNKEEVGDDGVCPCSSTKVEVKGTRYAANSPRQSTASCQNQTSVVECELSSPNRRGLDVIDRWSSTMFDNSTILRCLLQQLPCRKSPAVASAIGGHGLHEKWFDIQLQDEIDSLSQTSVPEVSTTTIITEGQQSDKMAMLDDNDEVQSSTGDVGTLVYQSMFSHKEHKPKSSRNRQRCKRSRVGVEMKTAERRDRVKTEKKTTTTAAAAAAAVVVVDETARRLAGRMRQHQRCRMLAAAFQRLSSAVPVDHHKKHRSRTQLETLYTAIHYIRYLQYLLQQPHDVTLQLPQTSPLFPTFSDMKRPRAARKQKNNSNKLMPTASRGSTAGVKNCFGCLTSFCERRKRVKKNTARNVNKCAAAFKTRRFVV